MARPLLTAIRLSPEGDRPRPLLVLGPSLGTSAETLWSECAGLLGDAYDVIAWDLPGHGRSAPAGGAFSVAELAAAVLDAVEDEQTDRGGASAPFAYAGDSIGGAVGLQLLLDAPERVAAAAIICSGAQIGDPAMWQDRAATVRESGTSVMVGGSLQRWFAPGFADRRPEVSNALLHALEDADRDSYAWACEALAGFDVRARLREMAAPVLALAGGHDVAAPPEKGREIAEGVRDGEAVVLEDVAHLAPAEAPEQTAMLMRGFFGRLATQRQVHADGMDVRRAVLGDAHVDRATESADDLTQEFQELITRYAWGSVWTRPGLDRRSRSMITLTALVAHGHWEELALHLRAALRNGLTREEVKEVLLQSAIYCGVPAANSAFRTAQQVFRAVDDGR